MSVLCQNCRELNADEAQVCSSCGEPLLPAPVATQTLIPPSPVPMPQPPPVPGYYAGGYAARPVEYAGFWLRFVAYIIDYFVLIIPSMIIGVIGGVIIGISAAAHASSPISDSTGSIIGIVIVYLIGFLMFWLYYALMESSPTQGTLGKMALGLKVTDLNGNRLSFARATGRTFAKIPSALIILIGYIMAGFTEKKQALHDIMASCLVVKKG